MTKRLISFFLTLVLLVVIPLSARYKYNPFTRKLDYYESASDADLGDLGDVTLTGLATGNVLYYNGTAWVNLATGANAEVLTLAGGIPSWQATGAPAAHAASHEVGGADLVDHDQLTNYDVNKHVGEDHVTDHNLWIGYLAGEDLAVGGQYNTFVGEQAGTDITTADNSVFVGYQAGYPIKAGVSNTAVGYKASGNLGDASWGNVHIGFEAGYGTGGVNHVSTSTAVGYQALRSLGYTGGNTAVGSKAGYSVSSGSIVAVGVRAGYSNTSGLENVYIGDQAGFAMVDGVASVAVGYRAMYANSPDADTKENVAVGTEALYTLGYASSRNVAVGHKALRAMDYESRDNVAIGWNAGGALGYDIRRNVIIGSGAGFGPTDVVDGNVIIGFQAAEDITTGEFNVIIGFMAGEGWIDTEDNKLVIDNSDTATPLIYGDFSLDNITINGDFNVTMDVALDQILIAQSFGTGTEDQPLIKITDARTGATANEISEATIIIDSEGTYAMSIIDGAVDISGGSKLEMNTTLQMKSDRYLVFGTGNEWFQMYDANGAGDDILTWQLKNAATGAIFFSNLDVSGMTDHDNYLSPTFVLANDEGADTNDYAGVVIGERTQANVAVAHYFDFYAMTGAADGSVDGTTTEIGATFRFGDAGSAVPDNATGPGDVLFEDDIEVDGVSYFDGGMGADLLPSADGGSDLGDNTRAWQDIVQTATGAHYYGDTDTDTTWKIVRDGTKLSFLRRETGAYVEKGYFDTASFHAPNIYVGNVRLEEEGGCLATNEFHAHGNPPVAGYFKFYQGTTPAVHKEAGHSILWVDANDVLYLEKPDGTDVEVGSVLKDMITITGDNATVKLEDDSGNFAIIKAGNSQLTIAADPDNAVASTDIVFDIDGVEVGRFQQGKGFQSKRGFATELWDIVGGHWETATTGVEYYSPNQQGGIYGTIYRQYFLTSLPSDLTSGNNVSALVDYNIQFMSEGVNLRGIAHGSASATETSDKRCSIWLAGSTGSNNLQIDKESTGDDYEPVRGWVDYTK